MTDDLQVLADIYGYHARIRAAAPELLEQLRVITDLFQTAVDVAETKNGRESKLDRAAIRRARVTIARAEGQQ